MRVNFVPLILAGLVLASCSSSPSRGTGGLDAKAQASMPQMPRKIVDLSPTLSEDFAIRHVGHKVIETFGLRERTEFEHIITRDPFYVAMSYVTLHTHTGPHHDPPAHVIEVPSSRC